MTTDQKNVSLFLAVFRLLLGLSLALILAAGAVAQSAPSGAETKVVSHVFNGYTRVKLADCSYKPESDVFVNGGTFDGEPVAGNTIGTIGFDEVALIVAAALKDQNFDASHNLQTTEQMIMLRYGTTRRTVDKPTAYELIESQNARILGFQKEFSSASALSFTIFTINSVREDTLSC